MNQLKKQIPLLCAVILVTAMTALAELTGEKEILFPEIAAIAAGALIAPHFAWNTSLWRMFGLLSVSAVIGTLIVLLPLPFAVQMTFAFLAASAILLCSRTTFAPMISAIVLPVMLQTRSVVYPVAAVSLSAAVIGIRLLLEKYGLLQPAVYQPEPRPERHAAADLLLRWFCGSLVILLAVSSGQKLLAAPPLLVAFTEFWKTGSRAQRQPIRIGLTVIFSTLTGTILRYFALSAGFYQFIAAGVTITLVLLIMRKTGIIIPPAAALSILAYLIPEEMLLRYPLLAALGTMLFISIAMIHGKFSRTPSHALSAE